MFPAYKMNGEFYINPPENHENFSCSSTLEATGETESKAPDSSTICGACGRDFKTVAALKKHLIETFDLDEEVIRFISFTMGPSIDPAKAEIEHSEPCSNDESNIICPFCMKTFKNPKGLNQHIGKAHSDNSKQISCPSCSKKFKHKYALKFHINQVHDKSTRVKCPECNKIVYNKYMLTNHLKKEHPELGYT
jgi:uncharacterized C2H2 Zn-finger protein